jgi:hypothetical protein
MTPDERCYSVEELGAVFEQPILLVSSIVGRGNYSVGEAFQERLGGPDRIHHVAVEELVGANVVKEDLHRYRYISTHHPWVVHAIYRVPIFYYRKYLRERVLGRADLSLLERAVADHGIRTIVSVSHRPAFWAGAAKRRFAFDAKLWGVLTEFGPSMGWKYQFWEQFAGFLSPISRESIRVHLPASVDFRRIRLPVRREFEDVGRSEGDLYRVLLVCGYWGQGHFVAVLDELLSCLPQLRVCVVCGENIEARKEIERRFGNRVEAHGVVPSLAPLLRGCGSIITKPGLATLIEASAAKRQIFLLKGMPVAEDHNAAFATRNLDARAFGVDEMRRWIADREQGSHLR